MYFLHNLCQINIKSNIFLVYISTTYLIKDYNHKKVPIHIFIFLSVKVIKNMYLSLKQNQHINNYSLCIQYIIILYMHIKDKDIFIFLNLVTFFLSVQFVISAVSTETYPR
jgi:hypothetical protein